MITRKPFFRMPALVLSAILLGACQSSLLSGPDAQRASLDVARFTADGNMVRPDVQEWIFMGTSIGLLYASGDFQGDRPGTFQIVHMEPSAYEYYKQHGEYADGTMFSMSFYNVQEKPRPQLNGFAQADRIGMEVHLIDKNRFADHMAFYHFNEGDETVPMVPAGNACVACHLSNARYDGTFTQFYPPIRDMTTVSETSP